MKKQLKQIQNQAQQGRSMVEMLGVLAIIGVLSIGGIAGYRMAMNRYQANQIANEINLMRTDAKMKVARGVDELLLGEPYDDKKHLNFGSNYGIEIAYPVIISGEEGEEDGEEGYSFTLSNIPEGVCKPLTTLLWSMNDTASLKVNEDYYDEAAGNFCNEDENKIEVAFSTKDIGGMKVCNPDKCEGKCTEDGECESCPEGTTWNGDECACPSGKHWNEEIQACAACGDNSHCSSSKPVCKAGVCDKCTIDEECIESGKGEHCSSSGSCVTCGTSQSTAVWNETARKCDYCKNVAGEGTPNWTGTTCEACPSDKPFWSTSGNRCVECLLDEHCQKDDRQHYWCDTSSSANYGTCKPCYSWDEDNQHCQRGECESNEDCDLNEYCKSDNCNDTCSNSQMTEEDSCKKYKCVSIQDPKEKKINGKTYYLGPYVNWWSAQRYCEALRDKKHKGSGKLVSKAELTSNRLWEALYGTCKKGDDTCCTEGKLCCEADSACPAFNVDNVWTSTPYNSESDNSCYACRVFLTDGVVDIRNRYYNNIALCE